MKDVRGRLKQQRQFDRTAEPKQCIVCGRWFSKSRDKTCSVACAEKIASKGSEKPTDSIS